MHHTGRVVSRTETRRASLRSGFRSRFEHDRGLRRTPAQEARRRRHPDRARPRLYDRAAARRAAEAAQDARALTCATRRSPAGRSRARLFLSAAVWSVVILLVAGVVLSSLYRATGERSLRRAARRLSARARRRCRDAGEDSRSDPGELGDPQFELALVRLVLADHAARQRKAGNPRLAFAVRRAIAAARRPGHSRRRRRLAARLRRRARTDGRCASSSARSTSATTASISCRSRRRREAIEAQICAFRTRARRHLRPAGAGLLGVDRVPGALRPAAVAPRCSDERRRHPARREREDRRRLSDEIAPLADELNLLISANREVVERARTQVGNLAHALKTPLSVIINEARARATARSPTRCASRRAIMRDQVTWYLDRARAAARAGAIGAATEVAPGARRRCCALSARSTASADIEFAATRLGWNCGFTARSRISRR